MKDTNIIQNVQVFGIEDSIKASKYPMSKDVTTLNTDITKTVNKLATSPIGSAHDNWLLGVVIKFDITATVKFWTEFQRYHFADIVSSQSTMHRITQFNLDDVYHELVDERIINIMKEKINIFNNLKDVHTEEGKKLYLEILYSNPCGIQLTAQIVTNYRQLKTIYHQRRNHRLPEWQIFCDWIETLPHSEWITINK